jgi:hypothetical protein
MIDSQKSTLWHNTETRIHWINTQLLVLYYLNTGTVTLDEKKKRKKNVGKKKKRKCITHAGTNLKCKEKENNELIA